MKGLSLFGQARFYENFIDAIADGGAQDVQNQIVRITASHKGEHLRQFHEQDNEHGGQECSPEFALLLPQLRQEKAKRDEHDHISRKIDESVGSYTSVRKSERPKETSDGFEGKKITFQLFPVGNTGFKTGTVKQQPQHQSAVKAEKERPYTFFYHMNHIQSVLAL